MLRTLSAAQNDELLMKEAKDYAKFHKDMEESNRIFTENKANTSRSMTDKVNCRSRSIEFLPAPMIKKNNSNLSSKIPTWTC